MECEQDLLGFGRVSLFYLRHWVRIEVVYGISVQVK